MILLTRKRDLVYITQLNKFLVEDCRVGQTAVFRFRFIDEYFDRSIEIGTN